MSFTMTIVKRAQEKARRPDAHRAICGRHACRLKSFVFDESSRLPPAAKAPQPPGAPLPKADSLEMPVEPTALTPIISRWLWEAKMGVTYVEFSAGSFAARLSLGGLERSGHSPARPTAANSRITGSIGRR